MTNVVIPGFDTRIIRVYVLLGVRLGYNYYGSTWNLTLPQIGGFGSSGLLSNRQVRDLLEQLPSHHVFNPHIREINYVDKVELHDPNDRRQRPTQIFGQCEIDEVTGTAHIWVFRQKKQGNDDLVDFKDTILHEIGHAVFDLILTKDQTREWRRIHGDTDFVWTEAGRDPAESFSEMYASYVLRRALLRRRFPDEYRFIRNEVFHNVPRKEEQL